MGRNVFVSMAKLSNVSGRIGYIGSESRQEHLYAIYATEPDPEFWQELAAYNHEEFEKSGTGGKCIEARELVIALPENFIHYDHDRLLQVMTDAFSKKYGVECSAALHHNKSKTNLHIHLVFSERRKLENPVIKIASRNMFYDEKGNHVRTKKEIVDGNGEVRKGCRIVKKGDIYERKIFTIKDTRFKQEAFLDEIKKFYTDRINFLAVNEKDKLEVFDRGGPYLATKKIGKNNPMEQEIKADNDIRMEWNRAVDSALKNGVPEKVLLQVKRKMITEKVQESIVKEGLKPELFGEIVQGAVKMIGAVVRKVAQMMAEKKEQAEQQKTPQKIQTNAPQNALQGNEHQGSSVEKSQEPSQSTTQEKERNTSLEIPQKATPGASNNPQQKVFEEMPRRIQKDMPRQKQEEVSKETLKKEALKMLGKVQQIPPQPELPVILSRLPELQRVNKLIEDWDSSIHFMEQKKQRLKMELGNCTGVFMSARRKELQDEITKADSQIIYLKKRRAAVAKENGFDTVKAFRQEYKGVKAEYEAYKNALSKWEKTYGLKAIDETTIEGRMKKNQQIEAAKKAGERELSRNWKHDRDAR